MCHKKSGTHSLIFHSAQRQNITTVTLDCNNTNIITATETFSLSVCKQLTRIPSTHVPTRYIQLSDRIGALWEGDKPKWNPIVNVVGEKPWDSPLGPYKRMSQLPQYFTLADAAEQRGCLAAACCWRRPEQSQTSDSSEAGWGRRLNFKKDLTLINFCLFGFVVSLFSFKSEKLHQCQSCSSKDICLSLDIFAVSENLNICKIWRRAGFSRQVREFLKISVLTDHLQLKRKSYHFLVTL